MERQNGDGTLDVAIVGGGPAGLNAAYRLMDDLDVRVFEKTDHVGGRISTAVVDGVATNTGAMYVYLGTRTEELCAELGVEWTPVEPEWYGVFTNGGPLVNLKDSEELAELLPISAEAKEDFGRVVRETKASYADYVSRGLNEASDALASVPFSEQLGTLHPEAAAIVETAVIGGVLATPEELSAQYALRYFSSYLVHDSEFRGLIVSGMQDICKELHARIGDEIVRLNTEVQSVEPQADGSFELELVRDGVAERCRAKRVIMAVPGPLVKGIVPSLPASKREAIEQAPTPGSVTLSVVADCTDRPDWDEIYAVTTVGTEFQLLIQPAHGPAFLPRKNNRTYFVLYRHRDSPEQIRGYDEKALTEAWLEQLYTIIPDMRGRVTGTFLRRWEQCFAYPGQHRASLLEALRAPVGNMHFAGDYSSASAGSHGAFDEGDRVAAAIRSEVPASQPAGRAV